LRCFVSLVGCKDKEEGEGSRLFSFRLLSSFRFLRNGGFGGGFIGINSPPGPLSWEERGSRLFDLRKLIVNKVPSFLVVREFWGRIYWNGLK